ncbi:MAG: DUF2911 domain-containing protein [bacterium]|nr:DUF2911 domain-containing protein [bacterium]
MKRVTLLSFLIVTILAVSAFPAMAERGDDAKRISKNGKVEGTVDGVKITIEYGRPKVKNRKIWDVVVPYGYVWRTGADEATTFSIDKDLLVEGQKLPAGSYALFSVPKKGQWVFLFNKVAKQWGSFKYDGNQDVIRIKAKPRKGPKTEELTFKIKKKKVSLYWDAIRVGFKVSGVK